VFGLSGRQDLLRDLPKFAATFAVAGLGGAAAAALGLPVPWISGAMLATSVAAILGAPMTIPRWVREIVFFFLGLNIGAAVTPETIAGVVTWPASLLVLIVGLPILSFGCALPLMYWRGWNRDDALMASIPGALTFILALADATGANVPRIAMVQAVRVAILTAIVPPLVSMTSGMDLTMAMPVREIPGPWEAVLLVGSGLLLTYLIKLTRFPAAGLLGALLASAALHATDVVSAFMPNWMLMIAFVVLGGSIGARFSGLGWQRLISGLFDSAMTFVIGFVIALGTALIATAWLGFPFGQTILAFAPGGFEVMVVMAFLMGVDAAYVGAHHTVRFVVLVLLAPVLFRKRPGAGED
jgi:uncharacterized protein